MKYHTRFPAFAQKHYGGNDETEEGEVNDGSETEEIDSAPSPTSSKSFSKPNPLFNRVPNSNCFPKNHQPAMYGLDTSKSYVAKRTENFMNLDVDFRSSTSAPTLSAPTDLPIPSSQFQSASKVVQSCSFGPSQTLQTNSEVQAPAMKVQLTTPHKSSTEAYQSEDIFDGLHDLEKMQLRWQLEDLEGEKTAPVSNNVGGSMDGGFVGGTILPFMPSEASLNHASDNKAVAETAISVASMWSPAAPPPLAVTGSRKEISQMHSLYHKACRLYERAVAKVSSTAGGAAKIDFGCLPQPPSIPVILTKDAVTPVPDRKSTSAPSSDIASTVGQQVITVSTTSVTATAASAATAYPLTTAAVHSPEAYSSAYTSAYRQTMLVMPKPADGGPPPNTPEHTALWRCYLNYYLQYYLQHQPPAGVGQIPATTVASHYPVSSAAMPVVASTPAATAATVVGIDESSAKRIRLATDSITTTVASDSQQQQSAVAVSLPTNSDDPPVAGISHINAKSPVKAEVIKATKTLLEPGSASEDGVESSKCVWISNLPIGVRAVDVKERCTPFGRVQTIKIIGSRKSKTPSIFAYLIMETVEAAVRLVDGLQGQIFQGQEIKVKRINALPIS